ncbi:MAG: hypothetical protein WCY29_02035 [Novosphingobium sp.]
MSDTKRSKGSSSRRKAGGASVAAAVSVLEKEQELAPVRDEFGDIDDILGELAVPSAPAPPTPTGLDDILAEISGTAPAEAADGLDDILNELAPTAGDDGLGLDDVLNEVAGPAPAEVDSFDDILSEIAGPVQSEPTANLDDILSEIAGPATATPAEGEATVDDLAEVLDGLAADAAPSPPDAVPDAAGEAKVGFAARVMRLPGAFVPRLDGTRTISRKAHAGLVSAVGLLGLAAAGEAAYIVLRPPTAPAADMRQATLVTVVPVDYSKVDLTRYRDKRRSLAEGGRDMLRNPAIKHAVVGLDNGEKLYDEIRELAQESPAADLVKIGGDRLVIASCDTPVCGDRGFRLVYDLQAESATVCVTQSYRDGALVSYSYGPAGYREQPSCQGIGQAKSLYNSSLVTESHPNP